MADSSKYMKEEEVTETVEVPKFVLELSKEEARTLADILAHIAGSRVETRRGHADSIKEAIIKFEEIEALPDSPDQNKHGDVDTFRKRDHHIRYE